MTVWVAKPKGVPWVERYFATSRAPAIPRECFPFRIEWFSIATGDVLAELVIERGCLWVGSPPATQWGAEPVGVRLLFANGDHEQHPPTPPLAGSSR